MGLYISLKAEMDDGWRIAKRENEPTKDHSRGKVFFFEELPIVSGCGARPAPSAIMLDNEFCFTAHIHEGIVSEDQASSLIVVHHGDGFIECRQVSITGADAYKRMIVEIETVINEFLEKLD